MALIPPKYLAGNTDWPVPVNTTLATVVGKINASGGSIQLKLGGTNGTDLLRIDATDTHDQGYVVPMGIPLKSGDVLRSANGVSIMLIFS